MKIVKTTIEGMQLSNDTIPLKGVPNRVTLVSCYTYYFYFIF